MKELKRFCSFLGVVILFISCDKTSDFYTIQGEAQGSTYSIKYIANEEKVSKIEGFASVSPQVLTITSNSLVSKFTFLIEILIS